MTSAPAVSIDSDIVSRPAADADAVPERRARRGYVYARRGGEWREVPADQLSPDEPYRLKLPVQP